MLNLSVPKVTKNNIWISTIKTQPIDFNAYTIQGKQGLLW